MTSLFHTQGLGDLYRLYSVGKRDNIDYNLAIIGPEFTAEREEEFDTEYMKALHDYGYQLARTGYPWRKTPPGFTE